MKTPENPRCKIYLWRLVECWDFLKKKLEKMSSPKLGERHAPTSHSSVRARLRIRRHALDASVFTAGGEDRGRLAERRRHACGSAIGRFFPESAPVQCVHLYLREKTKGTPKRLGTLGSLFPARHALTARLPSRSPCCARPTQYHTRRTSRSSPRRARPCLCDWCASACSSSSFPENCADPSCHLRVASQTR